LEIKPETSLTSPRCPASFLAPQPRGLSAFLALAQDFLLPRNFLF
jgi:hypothetical protein